MLTPKQRQFLKAQAHHLKPVVHIGKGGVTAALAAELDTMLESLELIKIKLNQNASEELDAAVEDLKAKVDGLEHVWTIGRTLLVFRPSRNKPTRYEFPA
ncbi:MAG TPA: ribosome assembly RNA-binding protein YhbY [Holophaga sp.]|nr:ribosome assembly RNA-binding protein YhbY [Holophaga sp.]